MGTFGRARERMAPLASSLFAGIRASHTGKSVGYSHSTARVRVWRRVDFLGEGAEIGSTESTRTRMFARHTAYRHAAFSQPWLSFGRGRCGYSFVVWCVSVSMLTSH